MNDLDVPKKTINDFLNSFGNSNDAYVQIFLETFFKELFNGNALPLSFKKKQDGHEVDHDILWFDVENENK